MSSENYTALDSQASRLLLVHTLFLTGVSLSNIFFNIYLWKISHNLETAAVFNLFQFTTVPFVFFMATHLFKQKGIIISIRLGLLVHVCFFLLVLLLKNKIAFLAPGFGVLMGLGQGLYYFGYNVSTYDWTNNQNRDKFSGLNGVASALAGMVAPLLGGAIIGSLGTFTGYIAVFSIMVICFMLATTVTRTFVVNTRKPQCNFTQARALIGAEWRQVSWSMFFRGLREGVMSFLLILIYYEFSQNELQLGFFNFVLSIITLLSYYFVGRYIKRERRFLSMLLGGVFLTLFTTIVLWEPNLKSFWLFGIANSLFFPLVFVPLTTISYNVIRNCRKTADYQVEFLCFREIPLNIGRIIGILLLIYFLRKSWPAVWLLWGLGLSQLPIGPILKRVSRSS
ncbi:MFS transporter [Desulfosporosinus sp. OT]|uniref:MFS transporter n=1 Tax=Desulfosporosinus sp. OT TaxID=913865 RepID=UPI0002239F3B|nr:MFS transporter [Desulfosporosinus sp. OT]EGW35963.1 putative membrane protein [Desulfosporosinus sp. OT]